MSEEKINNNKQDAAQPDRMAEAFQIGMFVLVVLAVLTLGEYIIAITAPPWGMILLVIAVIKAFFIIRDYMHLPRVFSDRPVLSEEEAGE